jgi:glycine cleavage system aminomethyltransferase T
LANSVAAALRSASSPARFLAPAGYVTTAQSKAGTPVKVEVRGKVNDAIVTKMPFVPVHYFKG